MLSRVTVANDLSLVVGEEIVPLTPSEGFRLAERLIRKSTARMVEEEIGSKTAVGRSATDNPTSRVQR
jgi:hypothetical protein